MATRAPRTRPLVARDNSRISDVLAARQRAVRGAAEQRREQAKRSEAQIVQFPGQDPDSVLTDIIESARNDVRTRRGGDYIHVSDLLTKCQRKLALIERHKLPHRVQRLTLMDALTFRMGEALHDVIRERAALGAPHAVWGKWKCVCGHLHHDEPCTFGEVDLGDICEHCGTATTEYVEVSMFDDELMIVGNPDLLLYLRDVDAYHVTELKSIAHAQWEELVRPKPEHVIQSLFYWYIMRKRGYRLTDRVTLLYGTKGYLFKGSPFKEFSYRPEAEIHRLEDYLEEARELRRARDGGALPARTMCAADTSPEAKKCEVCSLCFGNADEAPITVNLEALFGTEHGDSEHGAVPIRQRTRRRA